MATDTEGPVVAGEHGGPSVRPRRRRSPGPRAAQRRRRRRRQVAWTLGALVVAAVGIVVVALLPSPSDGPAEDAAAPTAGATGDDTPAPDPQPAVVFATYDEDDRSAGASQVAILAWDRSSGEGTVLLVPSSTVADIPGHGLLQLGRAYGFGEGPLLDATLDNLLGVDLDAVVGLSRQGWAALFARAGGFTVDLPAPLVERSADGSGTTRFAAGEQYLDGPRLAELITFREDAESELDALSRASDVLAALLDAVADDPVVLDAMFADGAPMLDITPEGFDAAGLRELFAGLAEAAAGGALTVRTLPVSPLGAGDGESYRLAEDRASDLIRTHFEPSVPLAGETTGGRSLEIRNGNGRPGAGQEVAQLLIPLGFRVVLTGNADRFDHRETRILVYDDDPDQVAIAEEIRAALGVGRVELSQVPQDIVDITIIVGQDLADG